MERLHPDDIEAIAQRVVELLRLEPAVVEFLTAAQVADRFGLTKSFVYEHAAELGAVRIGQGKRPRLRFDPERVKAAMTAREVDTPAHAPTLVPPGRRRRAAKPKPGYTASGVLLLPIPKQSL